ncbi:sigma-70 family RNA polymerase sigma factor [Azospirillum formosense]|uniref:Sigma-70 family RNA polymerase sigma factor n=1 Tax=Azospirillum formosense TaxID=861533 RepID=A0ABX2L2S5_9PROT|nr:sigma-70 family RNA polymerase sigma factor [Azospirillum formosense]MBY3754633.1 sigma-70 family RNA polymerase sigma factor [Azospirillum formosense]NUB22128.1 sigma-70 family RNA polymerase sigma factor [Azospirillum formosense]
MPTSFCEDLLTCIPELRRYALKLTGERAAAEDLVQDCLERALRNADKFEPGTNLEAWLTTILKHLFFTECRCRHRRPQVELDEHDGVTPPPQFARVALGEVGEAIRALPPLQRDLIQLVTIDGVSYQDAADRLGVPVGTIRSRLSRAREQIRHILDGRRAVRPPAPRAVPSTSAPPASIAAMPPDPAPPAPHMRWPRPSALPAFLAALCRRLALGAGQVPRAAAAPRWGRPWRGPARESIRTRGPPAVRKRSPEGSTKVVHATMTGSASILIEAVHSLVDIGNEARPLVGRNQLAAIVLGHRRSPAILPWRKSGRFPRFQASVQRSRKTDSLPRLARFGTIEGTHRRRSDRSHALRSRKQTGGSVSFLPEVLDLKRLRADCNPLWTATAVPDAHAAEARPLVGTEFPLAAGGCHRHPLRAGE